MSRAPPGAFPHVALIAVDIDYAVVARCLASPARSVMVGRLLDGKAMTAGELARAAGVLPSTASEHLAQLVSVGLITATAQGRHRYFSLADVETAEALEALAHICPPKTARSLAASDEAAAQSAARMCYDHIAGKLGVTMLDALLSARWLVPVGAGFELTPDGARRLRGLGVEVASLQSQRRAFARACLDWTERRPHLAGALGAGIATSLLEQRWVERRQHRRGLRVTRAGQSRLSQLLGIHVDGPIDLP
jgi:DNA-binding transcriptional ArsR family regulator